jgi:phosphoribosylcarboxyaminoimidazole (NCAIR) mutase
MLSNTSALYNVGILIGSVSDIHHHEYKVSTLSETDVEIRDPLLLSIKSPNKEVEISCRKHGWQYLEYKVEILGSRRVEL